MRTLLLAPFALLLAGCDVEEMVNAAREQEDFHQTFDFKPGGKVSIENYNGSVEISVWDQDKVEIHGSKFAPTRDRLAEIRIDIQATPDVLTVRTVPPVERRGNTGARYVIRVPRRVELERINSSNGSLRVEGVEGVARLRTSNGSVRLAQHKGSADLITSNGTVEARAVDGPVSIRTTNGRITVEELRGSLEAGTTNGSINAALSDAQPDRPTRLSSTNGSIELRASNPLRSDIRANTTNGSITVHLPAATNARIIAATSNSSISTDFDVTATGEMSKKKIDGRIGSGGPLIDLGTTNGSIRLRRSGT